MKTANIIARADRVPGWMTIPELGWLIDTARGLPTASTWVEIGTHVGRSFLAVALALPPRSRLIAIDHLLGNARLEGQTFFWTLQQASRRRPDLIIDCWRCSSAEAFESVRQWPADVVFVDGGHEYPQISADLGRWPQALKPGGRICGHDHNPQSWPGVVQAVDETFPDRELPAGSIWSVLTNP